MRLYYTDSYLTSFTSRVTELGDDGRRVYLEESAFYPTSGGQPHDTGELGGEAVVDVVDEGERVAHILASPLRAPVGAEVVGRIDWARRWDHMQQHTGQHLLSALFAEAHGLATVSVHFGSDASTLDLRGALTLERSVVVAVERRANEIVGEARAVTVSFESAQEATGLRKASERSGELRVVAIEGLDRSACGGTHVRSTAEIGPILLRGWEKIRGDVRVEFLCGDRALARAREDYEALARAAQLFSAPLDEVPALVEGQREQLKALQSAARRSEQELATYRARELWQQATPDASGLRRIVQRRATGAVDELRALAQALATLSRVILVVAVDDPATVLLATSEDSGIDAGSTLRQALSSAGGRGGGSPRLGQGSVPGRDALERVLKDLGAA
ncbi:MAG TPA: alanyl-tRNA editing protein [Longimicrobiales bacterium]